MLDIVEVNGRGVGVDRRSSRRRGFRSDDQLDHAFFFAGGKFKKRIVVRFRSPATFPRGVTGYGSDKTA